MRYRIRMINGVLNYVLAALLITTSLIIFNEEGIQTVIMMIAGLISVIIGLVSDFELGLVKSIRYKDHLIANILLGIVLLCATLMGDFTKNTKNLFVFFGLLQMLLPYLSYKIHFAKKRSVLRMQGR